MSSLITSYRLSTSSFFFFSLIVHPKYRYDSITILDTLTVRFIKTYNDSYK